MMQLKHVESDAQTRSWQGRLPLRTGSIRCAMIDYKIEPQRGNPDAVTVLHPPSFPRAPILPPCTPHTRSGCTRKCTTHAGMLATRNPPPSLQPRAPPFNPVIVL